VRHIGGIMISRRTTLFSIAGATVLLVRARGADAMHPGPVTDETPNATVVKGSPPVLDFGDGLRIPCDKSAFLTLWEGKFFWLTFGAGRSTYRERAQGEAVLYALGAMKLLLMTLAFAPDRLNHVDGGWRLKVQDTKNYVLGDIQLPGKPYWPINDAEFASNGFRGFGNMDSGGLNAPPSAPSLDHGALSSWNAMLSDAKVDAYTTYIVLKKNMSLDDVRVRAQVLAQ
jgi:hypothetical protein